MVFLSVVADPLHFYSGITSTFEGLLKQELEKSSWVNHKCAYKKDASIVALTVDKVAPHIEQLHQASIAFHHEKYCICTISATL